MKKRLLLILSCLFLSIGFVVAQTTKASGVVLDDTGETLPGVAVVVQGTTTGTITDGDGRFTINVPTGKKTLVFSLLGMQKLEASAADNMKITLMPDDATALDEVMVVAYGTAKKSAFTGSAGVVKTEDIVNRQTSNVINALAGQVAGVQMSSANGQPGVASTIRIRGIGSMSASNAPLYVVDGTPFAGDISSINPNDVESMTVLKDAASNALYGSRGANGVILITTKTGTTAEARVTVDAKWGTNRRQVPNYNVLKDPATYYEKVYEAMYNSQYYKGQTIDASHTYALANIFENTGGGTGYRVYNYPTGEDFILKGGKMNPNATLGYTVDGYYVTPDNWYDEAFDSGNLRQEYNISISGRNDKTNYFFSAGYLDDTGLISSSGLDRFTTRLKVDYQAKKWLKLGVNMSYTNLKNEYPSDQTSSGSSGNIFYVANNIAPIYPLYIRNADGKIMEDRRGFTMYDYGEATVGGFPYQRNFMNQSNPISALQLDTREYKMDIFSGRWYAQADIIEGLRAIANIGIDIDNTRYKRANNPYYGQYKGAAGYVYVSSDQDKTMNYQYRMTYNKSINLHNFDVMVGYDGMDRDISALSGQKEGMYNPNISELGNVINKPNTDSSIDKYSVASFIGRVQYDFADEFFGSASFTHQATSRFHKDNRWGDFWSIGGAWQLNRKVLKDVKWIKLLKYKLSYGTQGNDNILYRDGVTQNYYAYASQSTINNLNDTWSVPQSYVGNKDITWEKSSNVNTGIDFDIFNGKLSGSVEYFYRKTKDLLYFRPSTPSGGFGFYPVNVGSMVNKGFEFNFNSEFIKTKDLSVGANVNLTYLNNKIDKLSPELNGQLIDGTRIYKEGKAYYNYYLRSYAGVDDNGVALYYKDVLDTNDNPTGERIKTTDWQEATQYETGDLLADVYGGFGVYANFKGVDFSMAFTYQLGGTVYDSSYRSLMHSGSSTNSGQNWHKDILNSWSETNTNTNIPRVNSTDSYTNATSDRFLKSSDYLNFQNITLGYTLPASLTRKLNISSVRFYGVVDNLWLLSARKGLDPRNALGGAVTSGATYSAIRSFSGGLSLTF